MRLIFGAFENMSRLYFKKSPDPIQNIRWALMHTAYLSGFVGVVYLLNHLGAMSNTYPLIKATLILGVLINFLYLCGYILIAGVRYFSNAYTKRKI